ncbi:spa2 homology domain (SHD) of GIT domain-containing protein [Trichoderma breve]|uniref:Spa2 homology domain (SHD) of GIT domain-containing protein n=1 Tax=Trichoderma breve TaxID=2034170 RepID=A0A9W9BG86_9HYPO|nr:spa2 homology domain (SHD) of GIT domain-containing protein [Trichoderma breve]KAJ4862797.1 spa2 homology domain (SHD) of GIT domain-containing protein [Trichoderma breve]
MSTISDRNAPLSPVSVGGSEWSFSRYQANDDGSFPNRGNLVSPPTSGGSSGTMSMNGFPPGPTNTGGPSPPPSVGRSSNGMNMYARSEAGGESPTAANIDEGVLSEHYVALRVFLTSRDPNAKQQPNKARDKLLRLSPVQFFELSTDVYDELVRRQAAARTPPNAPNMPPAFLLPEKTFHPKRNQARQRLSSLGPPRFRDLAADVFHELERRFPQFVGNDIPRGGSSMSNRGGPMNRTGTPVNGEYPPRSQSRMRRPSNASSIRGPPPIDPYGVPPSPSIPNGNYARPMPRHPTQNNTIVPNKSTMIEEDDDGADAYGGADGPDNGEAEKKIIEEYETQVKDLNAKISSMEEEIKKKEEEMNSLRDNHQSQAAAKDEEKQELADARSDLEGKLTEAEKLSISLKQELERMREEHEQETKQLREQVRQSVSMMSSTSVNEDLQRENDELRHSLQQQQQVTEEVRAEAQEFLREMRQLSQQSGSTYEKQAALEKTIEQLENEVRDWRERYAKTKTQIRSLRGSSAGFSVDGDSIKLPSDNTLLDENGRVRDVHVTKYQMAIDELLQKVRDDHPENVIDAMKGVVVSVRRITRDLDESAPRGSEAAQQQQGKLRARISATANHLITVSKSFAASSGITPISLVDAAASHLTVAIVEILRAAKIRPTPAEELEDEEDGNATPIDSSGFFSPRSVARGSTTHEGLPPAPAFKNLANIRASIESSAYSPVNSPRTSMDAYANGAANGHGEEHHDGQIEGLKTYLEDQNALLIPDIHNVVNCARADGDIRQISTHVGSVNGIVSRIVSETQKYGRGNLVVRLSDCRDHLVEANRRGQEMADSEVEEKQWKSWTQTLPPIAFEIAREAMELVETVEELAAASQEEDDFS